MFMQNGNSVCWKTEGQYCKICYFYEIKPSVEKYAFLGWGTNLWNFEMKPLSTIFNFLEIYIFDMKSKYFIPILFYKQYTYLWGDKYKANIKKSFLNPWNMNKVDNKNILIQYKCNIFCFFILINYFSLLWILPIISMFPLCAASFWDQSWVFLCVSKSWAYD